MMMLIDEYDVGMSRPRRIDPELVAQARMVVVETGDVKQLRAAQSILLPALAHATLEQTAALLGVGRDSVPRLQRRFREGLQPTRVACPWGGRRRARMTIEEEKAFLAPFGCPCACGRTSKPHRLALDS